MVRFMNAHSNPVNYKSGPVNGYMMEKKNDFGLSKKKPNKKLYKKERSLQEFQMASEPPFSNK